MKILDFKQFRDLKDLQAYANKQYNDLLKLQSYSEELQSKIEHLEKLLANGGTVLAVGSNELEICKIEINRLYQHSLREPLDEKQLRAFDIYTKNLLAIQGKTAPEKPKKKEPQMTPEELISIALQQMPGSDEQ